MIPVKRWIANAAVVLALTAALMAIGPPVMGVAGVLYEYTERTVLARGVVYEQNRQMTSAGMLDVHILTVSLNDPYIYIGPVDSQKELGLKETASALLSASDAIAGVNGDFFGLAGTHSVPLGPVAQDGQLKAISSAANASKNEFAALLFDEYNHPFMRYMQTNIRFYNNGAEHIEIASYNKVGIELAWPTIIDRQVMDTTAALDARFPGLVKIAVSNGVITYVSQKNEPTTVPVDGYVVVLPAFMADTHRRYFHIGEKAVLSISNNLGVNLSKIKAAIGGGGLILTAGKTVHDAGTVVAGSHPRTAVGITKDGQTMILMTVDGRTHSIGATHEEMAALLLSYGAYDAMHLDGGGSTTMVVKEPETGAYTVVNTLSDGAERRIINALGVFDRSPVGEMQKLSLVLSQNHSFVGMAVVADVYGQDAYLHTFPLPEEMSYTLDINTLSGDGAGGTSAGEWVNDSLFLPQEAGLYAIRAVAADGKLSARQPLTVHELAELQCSLPVIRTLEGMTVALDFTGISTNGVEVPIPVTVGNGTNNVDGHDATAAADVVSDVVSNAVSNAVSNVVNNAVSNVVNNVVINVVPPELGTVTDGVFTALSAGAGYLDCSLNGIHTYVPVSVGGYGTALAAFDRVQGQTPSFSSYPSTVAGAVRYEDAGVRSLTRLDYQFSISNETQAAYVNFNPVITLPVRGNGAASEMGAASAVDAAGVSDAASANAGASSDGAADAPLALRMQVYGDASGNWLRGRVKDANGVFHNIDFTQTIDFIGWQTVTALLPTGVAAPFTLDRVYVAATLSESDQSYTLYFDKLEVLYAAQALLAMPESDKYADPMRADLSGQSTALDFTLRSEPMTYGAKMTGDTAVITLSAAKGGLYATNVNQWQWLAQDITQLNPRFVIILIDGNPLHFTQPKEYELFHRLLMSQKTFGRKVFVVSASESVSAADCTLKDGVRYINLPMRNGSAKIRFKTAGQEIWFDTEA